MKSVLFILAFLTYLKIVYMLIRFDPKKHSNWHLIDCGTDCGHTSSNRIIGGNEASLGQYPWIAHIRIVGRRPDNSSKVKVFRCGGVIINSMYILTAAHCVPPTEGQSIDMVRLGEHSASTDPDCEYGFCAPPVQDIKVTDVIKHQSYSVPHNYNNDICLLRLEKPIEFNEFVAPICMPFGKLMNYDHSGQLMEVAGWGFTDILTEKLSDILNTLKISVINNNDCKEKIKRLAVIGDNQLCGGGIIGKDSCTGDSGGPMMRVFNTDGLPRYFLIGIVSFGTITCAESTTPSVYTRVSYFMDWILDNIKP